MYIWIGVFDTSKRSNAYIPPSLSDRESVLVAAGPMYS